MSEKYEVSYVHAAIEMLLKIQNRRIRNKIVNVIDSLAESPGSKGKPLLLNLLLFQTSKTMREPYRILYILDEKTHQVIIIGVSHWEEKERYDIFETEIRYRPSGR